MATLYVTISDQLDDPNPAITEKVAIGGSYTANATPTPGEGAAPAHQGNQLSVLELFTDTVCQCSIGVDPANTQPGSFYVYPGVRTVKRVGPGVKVAVKTA